MLIGLVFWGAVIYGIVYLITHLYVMRTGEPQQKESPWEILKRRYAHGEINAEGFAKSKKDMEL